MKLKKAQEGIIVTVLLILIAIAAIAVVAYFVMNNINHGISDANFKSKSFDIYTDKAEIDSGFLKLSWSRGSSEEKFTGLKIVMTASGKSKTYTYNSYINPLETQVIFIPLNSEFVSSGSITVEVYPFLITNGKEQIASKTSSINAVKADNPVSINNLIAYYPLDGNAKDYSGNGNNNGIVFGSTQYTPGKINLAINLTGMNYVNISNPVSLSQKFDQITLAGWVYSNSTQGRDAGLFGKFTNYGFTLHYDQVYFYITNSSNKQNDINLNYSSYKNDWHYLTGVFNGTTMAIYIDGTLKTSKSLAGSVDSSPTKEFYIGKANSFFNGGIDEVQIYNRGLSAEEIKTLYDATAN